MGALVGGIYASGNLQIFRNWMCQLDKRAVFNLVDFTLSARGLVKGNKVIREIKKMIPDVKIENLPVSYTAVATDIKNKKEVVFEKNSLFEAIRASISIPTVFTPFESEGRVLVDGGVLNPIPINRIKRSKNDLLIAVDVNSPISSDKQAANREPKKQDGNELNYFSFIKKRVFNYLPKIKADQYNYYTLLSQSAGLMIQRISAMTIELYQPDILIRIPMNSYGSFHFYKSDEIIKSGRMATRKALSEFQVKKPNL